MVKQTRIIFGIDDIVNVRVQCRKCRGEIICPLQRECNVPSQCPYCETSWRKNGGGFADDELIRQLRLSLRYADGPVNLSFEIEDEG